jgi:hypothetical protein
MGTEVFRFVTVRPPQEPGGTGDTPQPVIDLTLPESAFFNALRRLRGSGTRADVLSEVAKFEASVQFVGSADKLDPRVRAFSAVVRSLPSDGFWPKAGEAFTSAFDTSAESFIATDAFPAAWAALAESIVAAAVDASVASRVRGLLVGAVRALWLIERLADKAPLTQNQFASAPIVLPDGLFPLPGVSSSAKDQQAAAAAASQAAAEAKQKRVARLATELDAHQSAVSELLRAFERSGAQPPPPPPPLKGKKRSATDGVRAPAGFLLSDEAASGLSSATKSVLEKVGGSSQIDVAKSVTLLERQSSALATELYAGGGNSGTMVRIGNSIIPQNSLTTGWTAYPGNGTAASTPGSCPPAPSMPQTEAGVTVPSGHGDARILGIADLLVLEQTLLRYELGEIAHIENVLKSEVRSRRFKTKDTTLVSQTTSTETTEEKEQDLSSTTRFQLQTESQTVINDSASKSAGLTIHASYGPSVDATANYNTSSSSSTQQSNTAAMSYATDVTKKAVDRVQTHTLTSRTVTTTHEIEEINRHSFDNTTGTTDITGIYRYVDTIYSAQIVNYGKRLMLEFLVPEPAAFLRYALSHKPINAVDQENPDPPGYCLADGTSFVALQASDITRENYLYWASKYGAADVDPPPASVIIASGSLKSPDQMQIVGQTLLCSDLFDVTIADGYLTQSAFVNIYGETQLLPSGEHRVVVQLQDQQSVYVEPWDDQNTFVLHLQPTPTLTVTVNSMGFHNYEIVATVFCTLSTEKLQDWQLKTFNSVMNAFNDKKSSYDTAIAEAQLQAGDGTISGTNPEINRVTEQIELKKGCISLLTGQRFELFDAMQRNVAPYGYPEIDFGEAKAEGTYIQMFEQSFEWNNMVYLFYPYFWGDKDDWVTIAQITDDDPLFAQFLQAGAARVQVPVRLGFEENVLSYLSTGEIWAGEGTVISTDGGAPDPLHLSIIDELKSQTGDNNIDGVGTLTVTHDSAAVAGEATEFTSDDESRRIIIGGSTYVIGSVQDALTITLTTPFAGVSAAGVAYATGGKLVGQPWEVKLPTDLIKLDNSLVIA